MPQPATYTGAIWRSGLPPGVYESRQTSLVPRTVRMDVAAFIGLAERGPVATPVVVESWGDYLRHFGAPGGGRLLPQNVWLFFANGGRRCVVVRALDYEKTRTAAVRLPGLVTEAGEPVVAFARSPGAWGNRLKVALRLETRGLASRLDPLTPEVSGNVVAPRNRHPGIGATLRFVYQDSASGGALTEAISFVTEVRDLSPDRPGLQELELTPKFPTALRDQEAARPPGDPRRFFEDEILLGVDLALDGADGVSESWNNLGLHPSHPRFVMHLLGRPGDAELLMRSPAGLTPEEVEPVLGDLRLSGRDNRRLGSALLRPLRVHWTKAFRPDQPLVESAGGTARFTWGPDERVQDRHKAEEAGEPPLQDGLDATESFCRAHFFEAPRLAAGEDAGLDPRYVFLGQPAPLQALETYNDGNETEPVVLVHLPDLVHPRRNDDHATPKPPPVPITTRFGDCVEMRPAEANVIRSYPKLALDHEDEEVLAYQSELTAWCQAHCAMAVLDLPPGKGAHEALHWRRRLDDQRGALYTPYLRCPPLEAPDSPPILMPPGGAVCGIIARRTRLLGVQAAPANVSLAEVAGLDEDPYLLDPAFLHQEQINAIRPTELGFDLLGSRTTSSDPDWAQISVRRLVDFLKRQLVMDSRWSAFEPNNRVLWTRLRATVERRLRGLFDLGAFAGDSPENSYFVRCDGELNGAEVRDRGEVIVEVGIAPSLPAEFILFQLIRLNDDAGGLEVIGA